MHIRDLIARSARHDLDTYCVKRKVNYALSRNVFLNVMDSPGSVFTYHSQERSSSFSPRFVNLNVTQLPIG